jgi:hypothetical protein
MKYYSKGYTKKFFVYQILTLIKSLIRNKRFKYMLFLPSYSYLGNDNV